MHFSTRTGKDDVAFYLRHAVRLECARVETSAIPIATKKAFCKCPFGCIRSRQSSNAAEERETSKVSW